ncbi:Folic acid synthesis protein fol1 [Escovopsis weberi]|uniref:Folic acid synthesis protein fol1 n=1 Tax=Escovopsis weberi TaxID=150374 RepID=A0A0M8MYF4_ESCWE|nr:Folic acid synthesis protein fol1 [Escovopsis weberi]
MPAPLKSLWELRAVAAGAPAAVRVRNLGTTVTGPYDAWGRSDKPQPASISAAVTFHDEFGASASTDSVAADTVHYGLLSKAILAALDKPTGRRLDEKPVSACLLGSLVNGIWLYLTGADMDGEIVPYSRQEPFLKLKGIRTIEISVHLPKATLVGDGVSVTQMAEFDRQGEMVARARALRFHEMRVPTLIGVNGNERQDKQVVVANIETDYLEAARNIMSDSSFETLEALAKQLSAGLSSAVHSLTPIVNGDWTEWSEPPNWRLHISLEKPIAVTLADAACVELNVWTKEVSDAERLKENEAKQGEQSK